MLVVILAGLAGLALGVVVDRGVVYFTTRQPTFELSQLRLILDGGFWAAMPDEEIRRVVEDAQTAISQLAAGGDVQVSGEGGEPEVLYDLQTLGSSAAGMALSIQKARRRVYLMSGREPDAIGMPRRHDAGPRDR